MYLVARCDGFHEKKASIWFESIFASVLFDDPSSERMITDGSIVIVRKHHRNLNTSSRYKTFSLVHTFSFGGDTLKASLIIPMTLLRSLTFFQNYWHFMTQISSFFKQFFSTKKFSNIKLYNQIIERHTRLWM